MKNDGQCQAPDCEKPARTQTVKGVLKVRRWCSMHQKRRETLAAKAKGNTCRVPSCGRPVAQSRSLCAAHLNRLRKHGDVRADIPIGPQAPHGMLTSDTCYAEGCERPRAYGERYCHAHTARVRHHGDPFPDIPIRAPFGALKAAAAAKATGNPELVGAK